MQETLLCCVKIMIWQSASQTRGHELEELQLNFVNANSQGIGNCVPRKSSASFVFIFNDLCPISLFLNKVIGHMIQGREILV